MQWSTTLIIHRIQLNNTQNFTQNRFQKNFGNSKKKSVSAVAHAPRTGQKSQIAKMCVDDRKVPATFQSFPKFYLCSNNADIFKPGITR